jgi:type IV pilus assembly protein PilB
MRLIDMGVEPYLVASALTCIIGQRLVRKLCDECATRGAVDDGLLVRLGLSRAELADANIRQAVGCPACANTGYRGRFGLYEVLVLTEEMRRLVISGAPSIEIERRAIAEGMDTLQMAGINSVLEGDLTVDEYLRVIA